MEIAENLGNHIPMFSSTQSTIVILAIPEGYNPEISAVADLKKLLTTIFPNAGVRRFAIIRNINPTVSMTTFISGNGVILTDECLSLFAAYISRCFTKNQADASALMNLVYSISADADEQEILQKADALLLEQEDLNKFTTGPFDRIKGRHEFAFKVSNPQEFIPVEDLALKKDHVLNAISQIIETWKYVVPSTDSPYILGNR